jgi:hypothetical protein
MQDNFLIYELKENEKKILNWSNKWISIMGSSLFIFNNRKSNKFEKKIVLNDIDSILSFNDNFIIGINV